MAAFAQEGEPGACQQPVSVTPEEPLPEGNAKNSGYRLGARLLRIFRLSKLSREELEQKIDDSAKRADQIGKFAKAADALSAAFKFLFGWIF